MSAPLEIPEDIIERVSALCLALPEASVRVEASHNTERRIVRTFFIRRSAFCWLVAAQSRTGKPVTQLVLYADPEERQALLSIGRPYFASRIPRDGIVVVLTDATDWEEIRELMTESYRMIAPKKLSALLD
jgi:hypothetical protein